MEISSLKVFRVFVVLALITSSVCQTHAQTLMEFGLSNPSVLHPGFGVGVTQKHERGSFFTSFGINAGGYAHKDYQNGMWLLGKTGIGLSKSGRRHQAFHLGLGGARAWVPAVYPIDEMGMAQEKYSKGLNYFIFSTDLEFAWRTDRKLGWFLRPRLDFRYPYFQNKGAYFLLETGIILKK